MSLHRETFVLFLLTICVALHQCATASPWTEHGVVKDVVDKEPGEKLQVIYADSKQTVDLGNVLTPTNVRNQPQLTWNADSDSYYTVLMVDPDAPSRKDPKMGQWRHWLVGNVKGSDISTGDVLTAYVGSGPPPNTGLHRYIFFIYKQDTHIQFDEPIVPNTSAETRPKFNANNFAEKYHLGEPIAGNFYQAEYDDYVPTLYKQLGN